ncbi:uncharacterized protein PITG_19012 [Phytophthora infestans T30-4]|uniref:Peptidase A2 domain-containing protein n=1 Tax=Phytophthora infestans (strain T30-4) TaxID=403677 RepID=D0NYR7_PHYIT|nr:uncharacterized protein PITG_19012 [Phytophthora infestans T30-4]EEY68696.1 conserved hypothetical protein [Phytophthora infestans T30-4]|eukprot:XP_002997502.1 conserved hypothetical protein [Phytophthora infestans T30-4]
MKEIKDRSRVKVVWPLPQPGEVMINEIVVLSYCADSGSDSTGIPRSTVICFDSVKVDVVLQTAAGTVKLPDVTCLVMEGEETDLFLGNNTLASLGIDVSQQLEQLAGGARC